MHLRWRLSVTKLVVLVMIVCLLLPQAAFAADETTAPKWKFTDVTNQWYKKHIEKMGLMNITSGYANGSFRPNNSITQEEAVIMTIRMMNVEDELNMTSEVNSSLIVSSGAKKFLDYALTKRIVNIQEEMSALDNARVKNEWGRTLATREWIAKLIVRAIGKSSEADAAANKSTQFEDEDNISIGYTGYINVAKNLGIVSGDNKGSFNPTKNVTRAEMAVFIGNAEKYAVKSNSHIVNGTVTNYSGYSISIQSVTGLVTLNISTSAVFYEQDNNAGILPPDITVGNYVSIIQYGNTAYYIEKLKSNANEQIETITGVLDNITQSQTILITVNGESKSYPFAANVTITSETGTGLSLSSLIPGSTIELRRSATVPNAEVTAIVVKKMIDMKTVNGTVERIRTGSNLIDVKESISGDILLYEIVTNSELRSGDRKLTSIGDLYVGDDVTISLKDGVVISLNVNKSVVTTVEGKVQSVDPGAKSIILYADKNLVGYFVMDGASVTISGMTSASLADIQKEDELFLELNADNKVQKIIVKNRSIEAKLGLEFYDFYTDSNSIAIGEKGKKPEILEISKDTIFEYNGMIVPLDKMKDYFTKGKKVDVIFSGDRITRMSYSQYYTGTVTEIIPLTNTIKINADTYGSTSFTYAAIPYVDLFGKPSTSLSDVRLGDRVQLALDTTQAKVQYIKIMQKKLYKVKDKQYSKLIVVDEKGATLDINSANSAAITHYDKLFADYNDIKIGSYVMVSFTGSSPTSIYIPKASYGIIDSVDMARNSFNFTEFGKTSKLITDNTSVIMNNALQSTINGLKANDRVELIEGKDGMRWMTILSKQEKTIVSYNATGNTVDFTRILTTENNRFTLADGAYIHKGTQIIAPSTLVRSDKVIVYFHNDKIVEIEKQ